MLKIARYIQKAKKVFLKSSKRVKEKVNDF